MKKLLYTVMCCCALASCTNLDSERYDAINPDFFPTNEKDAEALVVGGVYAPFRSAESSYHSPNNKQQYRLTYHQ